jgi:hypothetical protein
MCRGGRFAVLVVGDGGTWLEEDVTLEDPARLIEFTKLCKHHNLRSTY